MHQFLSRLALVAAPIVCLWAGSTPANATLSVNVGNISLQQNQNNQSVSLAISGSDQLDGVNLFMKISDGSSLAPKIVSADMTTNTIFSAAGGTYDQTTIDNSSPYLQAYSLDGTAKATGSGTWLRLVFDTTGVPGGSYPFVLTGIVVGGNTFNTTFTNGASTVAATITNGTLSIVPEPSFAGLALTAGAMLMACRRRA